jgi:integrative and conjugative element protein (TIGR02256 family)
VARGHSAGQQQALEQLGQIAAESEGAVEILQVGADLDWSGSLAVELSLDCAGVAHAPGGLRLRSRERVTVQIPADFPFRLPTVIVPHQRFAGTPHVQWGRLLCLYQAPTTEWAPGDGMFGFVERLLQWYQRAAAGTLDAPGQPLHPPVAYATAEAGCLVVHADAPRADGSSWLGAAVLRQAGPDRADVIGWLDLGDAWPVDVPAAQALADRLHPLGNREGGPGVVVLGVTVVLPDPIAFEFPATAATLVDAMAVQGLPSELFLGLLGLVARYNQLLADQLPAAEQADTGQAKGEDPDEQDARPAVPLYVLVGSPSRGIAGQPDRVTHLAAWRLPALGERIVSMLALRHSTNPDLARIGEQIMQLAQDWLGLAKTAWATVYEQRPELVTRRDQASPAAWLQGRRVLILGAGALGAPIAADCVRAGARQVTVIDNSAVHPGILVRQPYADADIGKPKAAVLAKRLGRIRPETTVIGQVGDVLATVLGEHADLPDADLIIDATANPMVAAKLELRRWPARDRWPPVCTVVIGHRADRGLATLSLPGATGAGADLLRRVGLAARTDQTAQLRDLADDLFPHPPRADFFQPEPGCSQPTFVGSASQVAALAAHLLTGTLATLAGHAAGRPVAPMSALVVRLDTDLDQPPRPLARLGWPNDLTSTDPATGYEVRLAAGALAELRAETRRGARLRDRKVETGGLLLGQIDDACRVVWVSAASGPPPDSRLSAQHFQHGIQGVEELIAHHDQSSAGTVRFVGLWHSHPDGPAAPSPTDRQGMADLLVPFRRAPRRALLAIVGGLPSRWSAWLKAGAPPDVFVRLLTPTSTTTPDGGLLPRNAEKDTGSWWPGGYALSGPGTQPAQATRARLGPLGWWWRRARQARVRGRSLAEVGRTPSGDHQGGLTSGRSGGEA